MNKRLVAVTIDLDWVCDEILSPTLDLLDEYGIRATVFCTHIPGLSLENHERCIHPVFKESDDVATLEKSLAVVPEARGVRSHSLVSSSRFYLEYERLGLQYESNYMLYEVVQRPFRMMKGIWQFPIYFMDDIHLVMSGDGEKRFDIGEILPKTDWELITFDFHPIHIFLNTCDIRTYKLAKEFYHEPDKLKSFTSGGRGTATLFRDLLNTIKEDGGIEAISLGDWPDIHA